MSEDNKPQVSVEDERRRRQKSRNIAVFCMLGLFVVIVYGVTIVKIKLVGGM